MTSPPEPGRNALASLLVAAQFACMLALPWLAGAALLRPPWPPLAIGLAAAALGLLAWTLGHNRLGNFNIRPQPKAGSRLVTSGPYRWIRHPMYSAMLLGGAALALLGEPRAAWGVWIALALVLRAKAALEEGWLCARDAGYADYMRRSTRFIPRIY